MNKISLIFYLLCIPLLISAQNVIYIFPIKPGTEEWNNFTSEQERLESLQIPDELLKSISTDNLIRTCINYPAFGYYTVFNNIQDGIDKTINNFNGLQELFKRNDAPNRMLYFYKQMDSITMDISDNQLNKEYWPLRRSFYEYLIAHEENISKINELDALELLIEARKKFNYKVDNKKEFSTFGFESTLLIMAKILDKFNYEEFLNEKIENNELGWFLETGIFKTPETLISILKLCDSYLEQKKL